MSEERRLTTAEWQRLYDKVKKLNLPDFIAAVSGTRPEDGGQSWKMICPMPDHNDHDPSFHVYNDGGHWFYKCYGCESAGTIIDFAMGMGDFDGPKEALIYILEKEGIEQDADFLKKAIKDARVDVDLSMKTECTHFIASRACHKLLRANLHDETVMSWVGMTYRKMNAMMTEGDIGGIERISGLAARLVGMGSDAPDEIKSMMGD
jgi:hypothetical protein